MKNAPLLAYITQTPDVELAIGFKKNSTVLKQLNPQLLDNCTFPTTHFLRIFLSHIIQQTGNTAKA